MRRTFSSGLIVVFASGLCSAVSAQAPDAAQVLAAAREALGGEKKLSAVKTFIASGRTRQLRGNNLVPSEFEITCELPDKFVRHDEIPAQDTDPTTVGFKGDELIQAASPQTGRGGPGSDGGRGGRAGGPGGRGGGPPRIVAVKQDFVRLTLGMFAASLSSYPVTFKYAAQGEAPEGKADILDVAGPDNFSARFVVQRETHLPVMLIWQTPAANLSMRGSGQSPAGPGTSATENRIYYGDYREVDGLKLPFRIRRAVGGETVEETTFDRFRINAKVDPRKFEAPK